MVQFGTWAAALLLGSSASVMAAPVDGDVSVSGFEKRGSSCTFSGSSGAASVKSKKTSCSTITLSALSVPAGTTLDLTGLKKGTNVVFEGETTFGYKEWSGPLVSVSGTDITVEGASGAVLNGEGSKWWDGKGSNGGKTKPKFFYAHKMISSTIKNLKIENSPVQVFSINGAEDLYLTDITIDNSAGDGTDGGHNTDAFDIGSSTGVYISGANVHNQDDCIAINSGTTISMTDSTCTGGHGLSIGSVGGRSDNTVKDVTFKNNKVTNSQNGIRIKTVYGATGTVSDVTFEDITLSGITKYGMVFEQDYKNGSPTGTATTGVPIKGLTVKDVTGTVESSATDVYILCGKGACSDWSFSGNSVTGGKTSSKCTNIPSGSGAKC